MKSRTIGRVALGSRLRSAWLARFASPACAAVTVATIAVGLSCSALAGTAFETQNGDTSVYTFGSPVGSGETKTENIGESRGSGTTTFSVDQGYAGATTVKDGTTISAIGRIFAGSVVF